MGGTDPPWVLDILYSVENGGMTLNVVLALRR